MKRTVFYVSDSTGITAETLGHSLLTQFEGIEFVPQTLPFIEDAATLESAIERIDAATSADGVRAIVFSTLTDPTLLPRLARARALVLDLFSVFIRPLEHELETGSSHATGRSHGVVDRASYEIRIGAVNFALAHDDGSSTHHYDQADIILVGVSRAGKTPTCVYLAMQFGIRAANYPLTEDDLDRAGLPEVLEPFRGRLFGLTIEPDRLRQVRQERRPNSRYASLSQCRREINEVAGLMRRHRIPVLDTSNLSIEEIASRIMLETGLERRLA